MQAGPPLAGLKVLDLTSVVVGRARTGQGQSIEVPMFENMARFVLAEHMNQRTYGEDGAAILRDFGFDDAEIADLMTGAVRPAETLP